MPSKGAYPFHGCKSPGALLVCGSFLCAGAAAPTVITGAGFTVSAPATGVYTITLTDGAFPGVLSAWVDLEDSITNSTTGAHYLDVVEEVTSDGAFTIITTSSAGVAADLDGPRVLFGVFLRNTSALR